MERRYEYRLELQEKVVNLDFGTYCGEKYWPEPEGYFPDYLYSIGEKKERQYLLFQMKENADPADEKAAALEPILCYGHLDVKIVSPGMEFMEALADPGVNYNSRRGRNNDL